MADVRRPRVIVGSSAEGLSTAEYICEKVAEDVECVLWNDGLFIPGETALESLEVRSRAFDGGLIVATADDTLISRESEHDTIRDNLLFEFGLFVAVFGRRSAILAVEGLGRTKLPSDLFGLTCVGFEKTDPLEVGLTEAVRELRSVLSQLSTDTVDPEAAQRLDELLQTFIGDVQNAVGGSSRLGFHLWLVDQRQAPPRLVRVARSRIQPKAQLHQEYAEGVGIIGECWRTRAAIHVDLSNEPYASASANEWEAVASVSRQGMDFQLLELSRKRYRLIGAAPIISSIRTGSQFLGCLSYNVGPNLKAVSEGIDLEDLDVVLDRAVEVVRIFLEGSK